MQTIVTDNEASLTTNTAKLASFVIVKAPMCKTSGPAVRTYLEPDDKAHGFALVAETLTDETSAKLTFPYTTRERVTRAMQYLTDRLSSAGVRVVKDQNEWLALKGVSLPVAA